MADLVTSDTHFFHNNIISFCNRPYKDEHEMNEDMISKWNEVVEPHDTVHHLGDFGFHKFEELRKIRHRLKGKIILVLGNHDYSNKMDKHPELFTEITEYKVLKINHKDFVLFHYPIYEWAGYFHGAIHCYGHVHNSVNQLKVKGAVNVGVDNHGFYPINFDRVIEIAKNQGPEYVSFKSTMKEKLVSDPKLGY